MKRKSVGISSPGRADGKIVGAGSDTAAQFGAQFLGDVVGIGAVADDLRPYEDDQLGSSTLLVLMREGIPKALYLVQQRNAVAAAVLLLADQASQQHGLAGCNRDRALDAALRDGRGQARGAVWRHVADLLLDLEPDIAVDIDAWRYPQDDAGVSIIDGVDHGVVGREHRRAA